jgi:(E)-4-hydroxy-3-methylbut-2-enyl-diphosphate synthase
LTDDPVQEIVEGRAILSALGIEEGCGINVISCPTCGRTKIDLIGIVNEFEKRMGEIKCDKKIDVAIMGCVVNGPGEAKECDIGIAGGVGEAVLFKKGEVIKKISEDRIIDELIEEINKL